MSRLEELMRKLPEDADCGIITSDINRLYYTGMKSSAGLVLVFKDKAYLIIDFRYIEKARKTVTDCDVILQNKLYQQINELLKKHNATRISVEAENMTLSQLVEFRKNINGEFLSDDNFSIQISRQRIIKTEEEISNIIAAQRIAEAGFEEMLNFIKPRKTEREIALALDFYMLSHGAEAISFDTIVLSGSNTSLPHGVPSDKAISDGEFVLMDFGAVYNGYHSDMTRTVCIGKPDEKMQSVYEIVLNAQTAALNQVSAGVSSSELDKAARDIIFDNGYGDCFGHSLGHGVGLEIHELPRVSPSCDVSLEENMIVTIEPGIYIPDEFGIRIEDFVVVKENGCYNMTNSVKKLICL